MKSFLILTVLLTFLLRIKAEIVTLCIWDAYRDLNQTIAALYNLQRSNPTIDIEVKIPDSDINAVERVTSTNCDIAMIDPIWLLSAQNRKNIIPLPDFIKEEIDNRINLDTGIYKDLIEDVTIFDKNKESIYGLPMLLDFGVLYHNTLKSVTAPSTWEELVSLSGGITSGDASPGYSKVTKYAGQFNEYRGYYYNFVEATGNFGNNEEFTLYNDEAKGAVENFINLFKKELLNEKAWNQDAQLLKSSFCNGEVAFMRNWSSYANYIKTCGDIKFSMAPMPKSKARDGDTRTLVRGVYLSLIKKENPKAIEDVVQVMKDLTSMEFLKAYMNEIDVIDIPPYLNLLTESINTPFCSKVNCEFYTTITRNLITKPIARFTKVKENEKVTYNEIIKDSYDYIKDIYKRKETDMDKVIDSLSYYFEDKYIKYTDMSAMIIGGIAIIGIVVTIVVFIIVIKNRNALVIRRSSPLFLYFMLIGILIAFGSVITFIGKPNDIICTVRPIVLVLAFGLAFLALFIKTFRIKVIFDKSDIKVQDKYLLIYSGTILFIELIIVGLWTVLDRMEPTIMQIDTKMHYYTCSNQNKLGSYFQLALLIINAIILLYGCYLAIKVKDVYSDYNESKVIGLSIYGIMICMIIQLIISNCKTLGHSVIFVIQSLMIILSSVILLTFMFIPKFWKLHLTGSSLNPNSNDPSSSQRRSRSLSHSHSNQNNNSYSTKSEKNGYINMQNVEPDYYNNNLGQRNNYFNSSSESLNKLNNMNNMNNNNNYYGNNGYNGYNGYRNNQMPDYMQYNY